MKRSTPNEGCCYEVSECYYAKQAKPERRMGHEALLSSLLRDGCVFRSSRKCLSVCENCSQDAPAELEPPDLYAASRQVLTQVPEVAPGSPRFPGWNVVGFVASGPPIPLISSFWLIVDDIRGSFLVFI
jgi:hypothetical protein